MAGELLTHLVPEPIRPGAWADPAPWNATHPPYRLPTPTRILEVREGHFTGGVGVLVDAGPRHGKRWLSAAWFHWPGVLFLV